MKSLKFSDYIEIVRPTYVYLKITSHKSVRNYNTNNITKMIALSFKALNKRIYKYNKKLIIESNFKISFMIDLFEGNANFYFIVPEILKSQMLEKLNEIWSKATIEEVDPIKINDEIVYELRTVKEDALSLGYDLKSNMPLDSVLGVMDVMKSEDRVSLIANFMPRAQFGWLESYEDTMKKIHDKRSIEKATLTPAYVLKITFLGIVEILDKVVEVLCDFTGGVNEDKESLYKSILGVLEQQRELSQDTKKKKEALVIDTQLACIGNKEEHIRSVCSAFRVLDGDNELTYKKVDKKFKLEDYNFNTEVSTLSTQEASNFIKIPGRLLLQQHGIRYINVEENPIPNNLLEGTKRLGVATYKGNKIDTYLDTEWNSANTCLTCVGGQGSGKTTFITNYVHDCIKAGEGVILIDFIKNCEMSQDIVSITPKSKLIEIDLAKENNIQAFAYNEMKIMDNMTTFQKLDKASMQSEQLMALIDSISIGDPLSSSMRRLFNAACIVTGVQGFNSLKDVIDCLENHNKRFKFINNLDEELKKFLEDEIKTLEEINEYDRDKILIGTKSSKISYILDRVDLLRSNFKLKYMYKANPNNNIDIKKALDENKVILIKMKDGDFPTKMQKNILVTYWITKVWLATQLRGMEQSKPNRVNLIIDEVFQAPTSLLLLQDILVQARKFALKPILSIHYVKQVSNIFDALLTSNGSFMLMKGSTEEDYNYLKNKIENLEYEDLRDMQRYNSLNLICHSEGYSSFITKLPKPI